MHTSPLPFPALVGLEPAQQALLLLAIDPQLRGVVLAAPVGSGKSSLARGAAALFDLDATPFVELPVGADEEALIGGLDIQATLRSGARVLRPGLLARAHGGTIYVDGLNLLPDGSANLLLGALENGEVRIEREGVSARQSARFRLIGSYDPAEGAPRRHMIDRVGLLLVLPAATSAQQRAEVVRRNLAGQLAANHPAGRPRAADDLPATTWDDELALLQGLVRAGREQLPLVQIDDAQIDQLASFALACGVEGHRADTFAVRAACAAAALALRDHVEPEDIELAARLVILPRATRIPAPPAEPPPDDQPPPQPPQEQSPEDEHHDTDPNTQSLPEEQVLAALASELPADLAALPFRALRRGKSGSRGTTNGKRGRHIRSMPGDVRRARIDITATLRAAAPWQPLRRADQQSVRPVDQELPALAGWPAGHPSGRVQLQLRADDLRVKQFRAKAGALFCFAVDASGSMALHRMRQAKGAVHALLQQAYIHRDRVALLSFRGQRADLLLPPSQSVELARRALDLLPTGGGTPLAAALLSTIEIAKQARGRGIMQTVLVLLTDGRANVGVRADRDGIAAELQQLGRHIAEVGIQAIVVDTQRSYLSRGEAQKLSGWLGGTYIYLPNASGDQIAASALDVRDRA